jgi:hypothetical protein
MSFTNKNILRINNKMIIKRKFIKSIRLIIINKNRLILRWWVVLEYHNKKNKSNTILNLLTNLWLKSKNNQQESNHMRQVNLTNLINQWKLEHGIKN